MDPAPARRYVTTAARMAIRIKRTTKTKSLNRHPEPFGSRSMRDTPTTAIIVEIAPMIAIDHLADFFTSDQVAI